MDLQVVSSLVQASPAAAVSIVAIIYFYKINKDFSKTVKEQSKIQIQTVKKMQDLTNAIHRLKEQIVEQSSLLKSIYKILVEKQRKIEKYEKRKKSS